MTPEPIKVIYRELRRHELRHSGGAQGAWLTCACGEWRGETWEGSGHDMHVAQRIAAALE